MEIGESGDLGIRESQIRPERVAERVDLLGVAHAQVALGGTSNSNRSSNNRSSSNNAVAVTQITYITVVVVIVVVILLSLLV